MLKSKRFVGIMLTVAMSVGMTGNAFAKTWGKSSERDISKSRVVRGIGAFVDGMRESDKGGDYEIFTDIEEGVKGIFGEGGGYREFEGITGLWDVLEDEPISIALGSGGGGFYQEGEIYIDEFGRLFFGGYREGGNGMEFDFYNLGPVLGLELHRNGEVGAKKNEISFKGGFDSAYALIVYYMGKDGEEHEIVYHVDVDGGLNLFNYEFVGGGLDIDPTLIIDDNELSLKDLFPDFGYRPEYPPFYNAD